MASTQPKIRFVNPPTLHAPRGYSHLAEVQSGRTLYVAGQVALDLSGNVVGRGDFLAQARQVFENIKAALIAAGTGFENVVKINIYATASFDEKQLPAFREIRDSYVNVTNPPTSTFVIVHRLVREEFLLEIEAVAVIPE
ncbi:MAG: RidA family protein [Chloroflexi bacterium]|nr:RidA family protein [Chloroflexota bacterium]